MSDDRYPYDEWVNLALQGVLRRALRTLSTQGFTGEHHLFISFDTNHTDVRMPGFLRAQYPDEITIVLQHQFEDLQVDHEGKALPDLTPVETAPRAIARPELIAAAKVE